MLKPQIVFSAVLIGMLSGCDSYVPKPAQITAAHGTFLVLPKAVTGHFANMDVDSIVFSYTTGAADAEAFWLSLDKAATTAEWTNTKDTETECHYERMIPKTDQRMFHSAEQVRVSYDPSNSDVVVAWVQADSFDAVDRFSQTGESSFADSAVWPRFNELANSTNGRTKP